MRSIITVLTLGLISSPSFAKIEIPPWGMSCQAPGYNLFILPNANQSQIEIEIEDNKGRKLDDNLYSAVLGKPFIYSDRVSNVFIQITGLQETTLHKTVVHYQNRFLSKTITFTNCDVN